MALIWPFARRTTYVNGTVPAIDADDLNGVQDQIALIRKAIHGSGFLLADDFTADTLNASLWSTGSVTFTDDSAAGAFGAVLVDDGSGVATKSSSGHIGTADFYYAFRVRISTDANQSFTFGLESTTASQSVLIFRAATIGANWKVRIDNVDTDLGVALGSTYQLVEVFRISGVTYAYVDGTLRHSVAHTTSLTNLNFQMVKNTTLVMPIDFAKLWFNR